MHFMDNLDPQTFGGLLEQAAACDHALCLRVEIRRHRRDPDADHRGARARSRPPSSMRASLRFSSASPSRPKAESATGCASCLPRTRSRCSITIPAWAGAIRRSPMSACCRRRRSASISRRSARGAARRSRRCWPANLPPRCRPPSARRSSIALAQSKGKTISVMMAYADRLEKFVKWYVQLWAESLGKDGKGTTPIGALGPVDQHSQLQLFIAGPRDKLFTVITIGMAGQGPAHRRRAGQARGRGGISAERPSAISSPRRAAPPSKRWRGTDARCAAFTSRRSMRSRSVNF